MHPPPAIAPTDRPAQHAPAADAYVERALGIVFREGGVAIALLDWEGHIVQANRAYERMFGWSAAELRRMRFFDYTHPEDLQVGIREVQALRRGEVDTVTFDKRYVTRDGRLLWARVSVFAVREPTGEFAYTVVTLRDVTSEREMQRLADGWRRRYETAILASRQVLYDYDLRTGVQLWAGACEATFGCPASALGGLEDWLARVHPEDVAAVRSEVDRALVEPRDLRLVYRVRHADGRWIWIEDSAYFVDDGAGSVERAIGFIVDVTDRIQVDQQRRRQEELFRLAAAVSNGVVWEWDLENDEVWRSDGLRALLGYAPDELPANADGWRAHVHPDDLARVDVREVGAMHEAEYRMRHRDGRWIVVWDRATVVRDAFGRARRVVGSTVDITERRLAAEEIRRLNAQLEERVAERTAELVQANRELEAFTYSVSHDLRAPLRHVAGFAELLRQRAGTALDDESRRYLGLVLEASARMGDLLDRLLDLSRLGRTPVALTPVEPGALVREVAGELQQQHPHRAIEWRIGEIPAVRADAALLRIVLANLLQNAVKYSAQRSPAVITVDGRTGPDGVEITVEDNGAGFEMRYADRLFGVFERLHPSGEYEGWGVGLASVQRIVARHGGTVTGRGEPDRGAAFTFTLPPAGPA